MTYQSNHSRYITVYYMLYPSSLRASNHPVYGSLSSNGFRARAILNIGGQLVAFSLAFQQFFQLCDLGCRGHGGQAPYLFLRGQGDQNALP